MACASNNENENLINNQHVCRSVFVTKYRIHYVYDYRRVISLPRQNTQWQCGWEHNMIIFYHFRKSSNPVQILQIDATEYGMIPRIVSLQTPTEYQPNNGLIRK